MSVIPVRTGCARERNVCNGWKADMALRHKPPMLAIALSVRFMLELSLLSTTAWFLYRSSPGWVGVGLSLSGVALLGALWGTLLSPRRPVEIGALARLVLELAFFALAAAALYSGGHWQLAVFFIVVEVIDKAAVTMLENASR
jgi:hypothetical protein